MLFRSKGFDDENGVEFFVCILEKLKFGKSEEIKEEGEEIIIDGHGGYTWLNKTENIIAYKRLNLVFQVVEKEIIPDAFCVKEGDDPLEYKYNAKFLKRLP